MKESIGVTGVFQIVILFILLFTGIMCLTLNHTNSFAVKNDIVNTIVSLNGDIFNDDDKLKDELVDIMKEYSYRNIGKCDDEYMGYDKEGNKVTTGKKAAVCIKKVKVIDERGKEICQKLRVGCKNNASDFVAGAYYKVEVFYQLDVPIIRQLYSLKSVGETKIIYGGGVK